MIKLVKILEILKNYYLNFNNLFKNNSYNNIYMSNSNASFERYKTLKRK